METTGVKKTLQTVMTFIKSLSSLGRIWADSLLLRGSTQLITYPHTQFNTADGGDVPAATSRPALTATPGTVLTLLLPMLLTWHQWHFCRQ